MSVFLSQKTKSPTDAFRQVELWSQMRFDTLPLLSNWTGTVQACLDGFDFVHLRGYALYSGNITTSTFADVVALPPSYQIPANLVSQFQPHITLSLSNPNFCVAINSHTVGYLSFGNFTGGTITSPGVFFDGITYATFL